MSVEPGAFVEAQCVGCHDEQCDFKPIKVLRRKPLPTDIVIEMKYCGVCHSDLHFSANHLKNVLPVQYPCIPGHELAGVVTWVGSDVTKFKVGDHAGVGCMVDSCLKCKQCKTGQEQKCKKQVQTYQGDDWSGRAAMGPGGQRTAGGYTDVMVVQERFAILIPEKYPLEMAGPVLCSGITVYTPLKLYGAKRVGVVGLGGLGVMGVKIARAMGATVTAISRSASKRDFAMSIGAHKYFASSTDDPVPDSLDLVINTVPVNHDHTLYTKLLSKNGKHVLLGLHASALAAMFASILTLGKSRLAFSGIGGIPDTQEVIDLCAANDIFPEIQVHAVTDINRIYEKLDASNDAGKRYVLDIAGSLTKDTFATLDTAPPTKLGEHGASVTLRGILRELLFMLFSRLTYGV